MENNNENFDLRSAIIGWPYHIRKMFKHDVIYKNRLCSAPTYNNWLSTGIRSGSGSLVVVQKLIAKYDAIFNEEPITVSLRKENINI